MNTKNTILSTSYFPPISYFKSIYNYNKIYLEENEYYERHSIRNRTLILSSNNTLLLTVPIQKKSCKKTIIKNIKIANVNWRKNHINSIKSAYGSAPFFIYYFANIEKIINKHHVFLIDLNNNILDYFLNELNIQKQLIKTTMYNKLYSSNILDQRHKLNEHYSYKKYQQIFGKKFTPNLSIIDLILNLGPNAQEYISSS